MSANMLRFALDWSEKEREKNMRVNIFNFFLSYFSCRLNADICVFVFAHLCWRKSSIFWATRRFSLCAMIWKEKKNSQSLFVAEKNTFHNVQFTNKKTQFSITLPLATLSSIFLSVWISLSLYYSFYLTRFFFFSFLCSLSLHSQVQ